MALLRQFIVFGTDSGGLHFPTDARQAGLERSLRFLQALVTLIATYPTSQLAALLRLTSIDARVPPPASFLQLQSKINLTRRLLRLFRFLEQFTLGWDYYASGVLDFDTWLDVVGKTCLGIFGMLESVTLLDLLEIDQLQIFGVEQTASLNYQAQYFWLVGLCISLFRSGSRLLRLLGNRKVVPDPSSSRDAGVKEGSQKESEHHNGGEISSENGVVAATRETKGGASGSGDNAVSSLAMKLVADALDLLLPATAVGLIELDPAAIATAMMISTAITANDVWVRCGKQMHR
ncbi:peroxisomal biogenesis factor 11 [Trichoderma novae-zelandiae]